MVLGFYPTRPGPPPKVLQCLSLPVFDAFPWVVLASERRRNGWMVGWPAAALQVRPTPIALPAVQDNSENIWFFLKKKWAIPGLFFSLFFVFSIHS